MYLSKILQFSKIESAIYDTLFLEKPVSDIINFNYYSIIKPPPKNTDQLTIKELEIISKYTHNRSVQDIEIIHSIDQNIDLEFINLLEKYNIKYPIQYIKEFYQIITPVLLNIKGFWNRPRPLQLAELYGIDIDIIITDTIHTPSYPSGHTVYSSLVANILQYLYPNISQKQLNNIVNKTAKARIMQGVHYPSDNAASVKLAKFLFSKLNPILMKE